jgi:hypothetical protein
VARASVGRRRRAVKAATLMSRASFTTRQDSTRFPGIK